jgi:polysaccharide export outer membrane protein
MQTVRSPLRRSIASAIGFRCDEFLRPPSKAIMMKKIPWHIPSTVAAVVIMSLLSACASVPKDPVPAAAPGAAAANAAAVPAAPEATSPPVASSPAPSIEPPSVTAARANPAPPPGATVTPLKTPVIEKTPLPDPSLRYIVQPGDLLQISVWKEQDLQAEALVRPDGGFSFPLAGEMMGAGRTVAELRAELAKRIQKFVPDAVVTVSIKQPQGNRIYVLGKVNRAGEYVTSREIDVMQALSLAGGATPYASLNNIRVLRRTPQGQKSIPFRYEDVERGRHLEQNIVLQGGDVVVVP